MLLLLCVINNEHYLNQRVAEAAAANE